MLAKSLVFSQQGCVVSIFSAIWNGVVNADQVEQFSRKIVGGRFAICIQLGEDEWQSDKRDCVTINLDILNRNARTAGTGSLFRFFRLDYSHYLTIDEFA